MVPEDVANRIVRGLADSGLRGAPLRRRAMELLDELPAYSWSGVYRLEGDTLVLDEYVGEATDHTQIPVGRGVCGTAVAEERNQIVGDVRKLDNYLACSLETRSEIVVLIRRDGAILGQIDVDGHAVDGFDATDEVLLNRIADVLSKRWTT